MSFCMIPHRLIMEFVGFTSIANNFHEFGETSGAGAIVFGILEIVGNVGNSKSSHDSTADES